ncbi:hypothetical protein OG535_29075 [Kitasatospora sp. NBC_00085]|uniref:hypothetical protein n=1 Tax=Kitasatospora sp. NBC_00085 TaxID=2903566 RepID=UPI00324D6A3A
MNPYNPLKKPGAHLVHDRLGAENPRALPAGHLPDSPLAHLARMVSTAARDVDLLHHDLTVRAQLLIERLEPIARGESPAMHGVNGVLQSTGLQVELIAARHGAAYQQLTHAINAYEQCAPAGPLAPAPAHGHRRDNPPATGRQQPGDELSPLSPAARHDPKGFDRRALQDIKRGDLWLRETPRHRDKYLAYGSGEWADAFPETVTDLIADGLVAADTSTSVQQPGHLLSLTAQGALVLEVLEGEHTAERRRTLYRSADDLSPQALASEVLEAVDRGGLRICRDILYHFNYIACDSGKGAAVRAETVEELIADGLLVADTSVPLGRSGRALSLTPAGEAVLEASRTAHQRVAAALRRSTTGDPSDVPAQPPVPTPAAHPAARPSRIH